MAERRAARRVEPQRPMPARIKAFLPARIVDLSTRGVQIELTTSLRPQVPCDLRIQLDQGEVVVRGIVRRCRAWGFGLDDRDQRVLLYRAGLEFDEVPPDALMTVVAGILESAKAEAAAAEPSAAKAAPESPAAEAPEPEAKPARAPEGAGRVKIRISAEHVRKVLDGPKSDKGDKRSK